MEDQSSKTLKNSTEQVKDELETISTETDQPVEPSKNPPTEIPETIMEDQSSKTLKNSTEQVKDEFETISTETDQLVEPSKNPPTEIPETIMEDQSSKTLKDKSKENHSAENDNMVSIGVHIVICMYVYPHINK